MRCFEKFGSGDFLALFHVEAFVQRAFVVADRLLDPIFGHRISTMYLKLNNAKSGEKFHRAIFTAIHETLRFGHS